MRRIYKIEALRGFAALYVLIHHLNIGQGSFLKYILQQGQVAVIMFFIISGFVLNLSNRDKIYNGKINFRNYFINRFKRIYPVLISSMIIAYFANCLAKSKFVFFNWQEFVANLFNIQDLARHPGFWYEAFAGNTPLWSLSYEWWFYILFFPITKYVKFEYQRYVALGISIFGFFTYVLYPNQFSIIFEYFIVWWSGVELAQAWKSNKLVSVNNLSFIYGSLFILLALQIIRIYLYSEKLQISYYPIINSLHTTFAIFLISAGLIWYKMKFIGFEYTFGNFKIFGPISYSIYLFHYPLIMKYNFDFFSSTNMQYFCMTIFCFLICYFVEIKFQKKVNQILILKH
jgi:peptidoglycan/LPS O-acetylase OafA/YrhL